MRTDRSRRVSLGLLCVVAASRGLLAQPADSAGAEYQANVYATGDQSRPAADMDSSGDFVVVWSSAGQDGSADGVFGRRFNAAGVPQGAEFQANVVTLENQLAPSVGMDTDGDFVVAWQSTGQDGSGEGVFAQRFGGTAVLDIDGNGTLAALTDGLLVLRYLFGLTGTSLTGSAVGAGCTRCDAASIEGYLDTLI